MNKVKEEESKFGDLIKFNTNFMTLEKSLHILNLSVFIIGPGIEKFC